MLKYYLLSLTAMMQSLPFMVTRQEQFHENEVLKHYGENNIVLPSCDKFWGVVWDIHHRRQRMKSSGNGIDLKMQRTIIQLLHVI